MTAIVAGAAGDSKQDMINKIEGMCQEAANMAFTSGAFVIGSSANTSIKSGSTITFLTNESTATANSAHPTYGFFASKTTAEYALTATTHDITANPNVVMERAYIVTVDSGGTVTITGGNPSPLAGTAPIPPRPLVCATTNPYMVTGALVTTPGAGYTSVPTVTVSAPPTGGKTAVATATLNKDSVVTINIIDPGYGYTSTAATITVNGGGATTTAVATAIMTQVGNLVNGCPQIYGTVVATVRIAIAAGTPGSGTNYVAATTPLNDARLVGSAAIYKNIGGLAAGSFSVAQ